VDPWVCLDLFWRFLLISLVAFGGSQSVLSLVERAAVREAGWVSAEEYAAALGSSYASPGPIGMMAAFIGCRAGGLPGALSATLGTFLVPWLIAAGASRLLRPVLGSRRLLAFGRGAGAAVVGLQAVAALDLARHAFTSRTHVAVASVALALTLGTKVNPVILLLGGAVVGLLAG
jgi:chromate transporter